MHENTSNTSKNYIIYKKALAYSTCFVLCVHNSVVSNDIFRLPGFKKDCGDRRVLNRAFVSPLFGY